MALRGNEPIEKVANPLTATHNWIMGLNRSGGDIAQGLTSAYGFMSDAIESGSLEKGFVNQFLRNKDMIDLKDKNGNFILDDNKQKKRGYDFSGKNLRKGKLIGGLIGGVGMISIAGGMVRGALTDKNEKLDLPGIPGI